MQTILENLAYIAVVVFLLEHHIQIRSLRKELDECKKNEKNEKNS